jgi:hypothetical protein
MELVETCWIDRLEEEDLTFIKPVYPALRLTQGTGGSLWCFLSDIAAAA